MSARTRKQTGTGSLGAKVSNLKNNTQQINNRANSEFSAAKGSTLSLLHSKEITQINVYILYILNEA